MKKKSENMSMENEMEFDPDAYTISIRKEKIDNEVYFVGRVAELPNITAFEDTYEAARTIVIDAIQTWKAIADENHAEFPLPYPASSNEFSGRITLRLPKSLHAKITFNAAQENVSVNQYLTTAIATYVGETEGIFKVTTKAKEMVEHLMSSVSNVMNSRSDKYFISNNPIYTLISPVESIIRETRFDIKKVGVING